MTKSEFSVVRTEFRGLTTARICAFRYEIYYKTFTKMFPMPSRKATVHYLPGNNDVGLNVDPIESLHARRRFTRHFGPLDQTVVIQNHTLVLLDASGLIEESYRRKPATREHEFPEGGTMSFARSVQPGSPKILRSFPDCSEDLDLTLHSVQVTRPILLSCSPIYPCSDLKVQVAGRCASWELFDEGLAPTTRVPSERIFLRFFWIIYILR